MSVSNNSFSLFSYLKPIHELLSKRKGQSEKICHVMLRQLMRLDIAFDQLQNDLQGHEIAPIALSQLIEAKAVIGLKLLEKTTPEEFMTFSSDMEKMVINMNQDKVLEVVLKLNKIAQNLELKEGPFYLFKTDEEKLGPKLTMKTLEWLQKVRTQKLASHPDSIEMLRLMKGIGDLEDRLKSGDYETFQKLFFDLEIDLDKVKMELIDNDGGISESYFIYDGQDNRVAIFKPCQGDAGKEVIPQGQSLKRQAAAFLIDKMNGGKAGVAFTLRGISREKGMGAIQVFKNNGGNLSELKLAEIERIDPRQFHYLALHRLRMYDIDCHLGNVLWNLNQKGEIDLISIDHDFCFPLYEDEEQLRNGNNQLKIHISQYPQLSAPFDQKLKDYIQSWDVEREAELLTEMGFDKECVNLFKTMSWFIQEAQKNDLLPGEILDYALSQDYSFMERYELVRFMIEAQKSDDFELKMKAFIREKVEERALEIKRNGSWRREASS